MGPANRDGELVANAPSHGMRLCEREVMRIRWHAAAHETGLPEHEPAVLLVAQPNRFAQSMDRVAVGSFPGSLCTFVGCTQIRHADGQYALVGDGRWANSG
jgi:hypothetical protein